jgi:hypothetical protein
VAETGAEIDVVGAQDAGEFLQDIVDFVGETTGGREESHLVRRRATDRFAGEIKASSQLIRAKPASPWRRIIG